MNLGIRRWYERRSDAEPRPSSRRGRRYQRHQWKRLRGTGTGDLPCVGRDGKRRPGRIDREAIEARNAEIVRLRAGGMKHLDIARALGCSRATVENCLRARRRRDRYKGVV
jgi:DNA invertase Pin-like site-specific DNA recombinase